MTITLLGEPFAIDLMNTLKTAHDPIVDQLASPAALDEFWRFQVDRDPTLTPLGHEDTLALRGIVTEIVSSIREQRAPDVHVLTAANTLLYAAPTQTYLRASVDGIDVEHTSTASHAADVTRARAILSAIELTARAEDGRLRRCAAEDCSQLFVALNSKRRWCTAAGCGNRARVSRHAARVRTPATA
ncbi:zf-CGNR multi-domain protein [Mycetocola tolaasinivorans]|uniref:Zf-CGNR multi-domain protein n=1 Tax=Mycetocola tolaasinivorans TaxID=76635 RepID=A0A3L7AD41_9MICO|nr:CGNR zinc finger domain-containing protein [Mycetocola tolaasinivorans]RLP77935.1 zf-CGNR multi-domain protein [Mycetocola tolaasinivorans]